MGEKTNEKYIYHDKNGTFKAAPWMRCPRTNKRIKREKGGIPTMAEAIAWRDQKILEVEGVPEPAPLRRTFGHWVIEWFEQREEWLAPSTRRTYLSIIKHQIIPVLGDVFLDIFDREDLIYWRDWAQAQKLPNGKPVSDQTLLSWWRVLKTIVKDWLAQEQRFDFTVRIRAPKSGRRQVRDPRTLTVEQIHDIVVHVREHARTRFAEVATLAYTGMRSGELFARGPADTTGDLIHIHSAVSAGVINDVTKTGWERHAFASELVREAAEEHWKVRLRRQHRSVHSGLLYGSEAGTPRFPGALDKTLVGAAAALGIEQRVSPRVLRRSYNTALAESGAPELVLLSQMGHSSGDMSKYYFSGHAAAKQQAHQAAFGA